MNFELRHFCGHVYFSNLKHYSVGVQKRHTSKTKSLEIKTLFYNNTHVAFEEDTILERITT